jgi:hypothetical protein
MKIKKRLKLGRIRRKNTEEFQFKSLLLSVSVACCYNRPSVSEIIFPYDLPTHFVGFDVSMLAAQNCLSFSDTNPFPNSEDNLIYAVSFRNRIELGDETCT